MTGNNRGEIFGLMTAWLSVWAGKALSAAHALGINTWGEGASAMAMFYTFLLACGWFWRYFWRPLLGWLYRRHKKAGP